MKRERTNLSRVRRALITLVSSCLLATALPWPATGAARPRLKELAQVPIAMDRISVGTGTNVAVGSELAFQGDLLVAGAYEGVGFFRILDKAPYLEQLSFFDCPGGQGDVSIWGDYVFVSNEHQSSYLASANLGVSPSCNAGVGAGMEGIRIIDISDVKNPRQVTFVPIVCGSHDNTLVPHKNKLYIYNSALALSYAGDYAKYCQRMTIIEVPIEDPAKARIVAEPPMDLDVGCHDITAFPEEGIALGACWTDSWLWDIRDPADPKIISKLPSDWDEGHHSASFTWDGKYVAIGQESGNCTTEEGEIAFYDIRDRSKPKQVGRFHIPRVALGGFCWSHNFAVVPTKDRSRYVLTAGFYNGGTTVVDFSHPRAPRELAFAATPREGRLPSPWGAYWYNGRIYSNDYTSGFGVTVYEMDGLSRRDGRTSERLNPQLQTRRS